MLFARLEPQHPNLAPVKTALDLGCGDRSIFKELRLAEKQINADPFPCDGAVKCTGENLPFADASFDLIVARVSLPYMNLPKALPEIRRVLTNNGILWATLHLPRMAWKRALHSYREGDPMDVPFQFCVLLNCTLIRFGFQLPFRGRYESVQTPGSITSALKLAGFSQIKTDLQRNGKGLHFAVQACCGDH